MYAYVMWYLYWSFTHTKSLKFCAMPVTLLVFINTVPCPNNINMNNFPNLVVTLFLTKILLQVFIIEPRQLSSLCRSTNSISNRSKSARILNLDIIWPCWSASRSGRHIPLEIVRNVCKIRKFCGLQRWRSNAGSVVAILKRVALE
jgi:hypothetical protein